MKNEGKECVCEYFFNEIRLSDHASIDIQHSAYQGDTNMQKDKVLDLGTGHVTVVSIQ